MQHFFAYIESFEKAFEREEDTSFLNVDEEHISLINIWISDYGEIAGILLRSKFGVLHALPFRLPTNFICVSVFNCV